MQLAMAMLMLSTALLLSTTTTALPPGFAVLDPSAYADNLRGDFAWAVANVPFVRDICIPAPNALVM